MSDVRRNEHDHYTDYSRVQDTQALLADRYIRIAPCKVRVCLFIHQKRRKNVNKLLNESPTRTENYDR